jgi:uncharacterized caspase-like protein
MKLKGILFFPMIFSLFLLGCSLVPKNSDMDFYALIIGINYDTNLLINNLNWCEDDADSMYSSLTSENNGWNAAEITLLLGPAATKAGIENALNSILAQAGENDLVLVYFSGHGVALVDLSGDEEDGYDEAIVPVDCVPSNSATFLTDDELGTLFQTSRTQKGVFILDSCYSGGLINKPVSMSSLTPKSLDNLSPRGSGGSGDLDVLIFPVMTAASQNEESWEDSSLKHGIFTYFLIEGLTGRRADKNGDGFITVRELFHYAENHTEFYIPIQHPVMRFPMDFIDILITR